MYFTNQFRIVTAINAEYKINSQNPKYYAKFINDVLAAGPNRSNRYILNQVYHDQFVNTFIQPIYLALREYGNSKAYAFASDNERNQYYHGLAWGGLTGTNAFNSLSTCIKNRILDTVATEQYGTDRNGAAGTKRGGNAGC